MSGFQDDFIAAIFGGAPASAEVARLAVQPGFAVYRNTILKACIDNLAANFPAVQRLVGEQWFRAAALEYARTEAPQQVSLFHYGAGFPVFLASFPPAAELPYLSDVARLDRMWIASHTAEDAEPLQAADLSRMPPEALGAVSLAAHPAARWICFEAHPSAAIWIANRELREFDAEAPWRGDSVLLTRLDGAVEWRLIERGAVAFLDACAGGAALQDAAEAALATQPDLDIAATLAKLLHAGAFQSPPDES